MMQKRLGLLVLSLLALALPLYANPMTAKVDLKDVFKESSAIWQNFVDHESFVFNRDEDRYAVIGQRDDGVIAVIVKTPGYEDNSPKVKVGYFMKCGTNVDTPFFLSDVASLKEDLDKPSFDNPDSRMPFDESMAINDVYITVCGE